jgi:regulator of sirC expression with transglutaminase-like and TPR domain
MKDKEIISLIRLLEDKDLEISGIITKKLLEKGADAISDLEKAWETELNPMVQYKIEEIVHGIQFNQTKQELQEWFNHGSESILYGAFLLAKYQFPDLKYSEIENEIEKIRLSVWIEFHENLTALEKVRIINHILFAVNKFSGNTANFYSPGNSFINQVLETKKGNPITLSIIYASVAQRLEMPIYGVNLPRNYILAYELHSYLDDPDGILFYINPYNNGNVLGRKEIDFFLSEQKMEQKPEYYRPCTNKVTIERMFRNLQFSLEKMGQEEKAREIEDLLKIFRNPLT